MFHSLRVNLPQLLDRYQFSEPAVLLGTALAIGAGTGIGAVFFIGLIGVVERAFFSGGEQLLGGLGRGLIILIPMAGGLLAGPIIAFFAKEAKGHGVPEVMQAIALQGGRIRPRVVVAKIAASALCIGSGGSAGREGPIVQVGAALGSSLGQWLNLSEERIRNLVACGAAAGIAATFNAPIAGVIFALEIIMGELHPQALGNVVISAVTASTLARVFLGDSPAFPIPKYQVQSAWEILLYAVLGLLAAIVAVWFIKLLYWFEDRFDEWTFPDALKPAVGGLLLGGLAFGYPIVLGVGRLTSEQLGSGLPVSANIPHVFGAGFVVIEEALLGHTPFLLLLALIFLKPLATSLTLGSGNSGGVFAPALFTGAALGGAFGQVVEQIAPGLTAGPGAFAVVGMAAVFAGAARAPITAVLIVFEMTDDYRLIIPLMAGVIISTIVAEVMHRESIYTLKLARRGIRLQRGRDVEVLETIRVEEVMKPPPVTMNERDNLATAAEMFLRTRHHGVPVVNDQGKLIGVVTVQDLDQAEEAEWSRVRVGEVCTRHLLVAYPDESIGAALRRMGARDVGRMPVVAREDETELLGWLRRGDVVKAYDVALSRRAAMRHRTQEAKLRATSGREVSVEEVRIEDEAWCAGKRVNEVSWPRECIIASLRRGGVLMIPHGDTILRKGDVLVVVAEEEAREEVQRLCRLLPEEKHLETPAAEEQASESP